MSLLRAGRRRSAAFSFDSMPTPMRVSRTSAALRAPITVLSLLAASIAHAQNPALAPARSDSIYHLAVDSAAYKDYAFVYLLDDGIAHFDADGRGTQRYHQVVQILKTQGVGVWAERQFSYRPGHDKVTVNWMRVVRPSGEVISDKPSITQASDIPAAMSNPVYSDTKVVRYSLSGVTVGTLVDISWTDEILDPYLAGDFVSSWRTTMDFPAMRSRFVLDVPASFTPRIEERHVDIKRVEQQASGRQYYVWAKQSVMPVKGEVFAPDSAIPRMGIDVVSPTKWADIARWYGGLAADRYAMSARTTAIVDSIARAQHSADDTIAALHTWIARDIRYVSVALGMGGYQPRFPDSTVTAGFGDCKDKATLFIAAAKHLGVTAYPVLLNSSGAADSTLPTIGQFDHAIAAVANKSGGYTYLDLTTAAFEPGQIPPNYQGGFGLVVLPGGKSEEIRFPKESSGVQTTHFDGVVADDGTMSGQLEFSAKGGAGTSFRAMFSQPLDSARRAAVTRSFAAILPGAKPDTLVVSDMRDARTVPEITVRLHGADGFRRAGTVSVLTVPPPFYSQATWATRLLAQLDGQPARRFPIDAARVWGSGTAVTELRLTVPAGWKVELPTGTDAKSVFGEYRSEYSQDGRTISITTRTTGAEGVLPKERLDDLRAWLKAIAADEVSSIVARATPAP
jgi:transglutaminase-like putative cysteine protease